MVLLFSSLKRRTGEQRPEPVGSAPNGPLCRESSRNPHVDAGYRPVARDEKENCSADRGFFLCAKCLEVIAGSADRIAVQGLHHHVFANPHGIVYEIGCFASAKGCGSAGPATDEFSWFKGYRWKIVYCRMCLTHLGWWFVSEGMHAFYGLIVDRLIESGGWQGARARG